MSGLPEGWGTFTLRDLGGTVGGKTPSKSKPSFWSSRDVYWTSPKDMKSFRLTSSEDMISRSAIAEAGMRVLPRKSVLIVTRSGILAHTLPVAIADIDTAINQDIKAVLPNPAVEPRYLAYLLRANSDEILRTCSKEGTTVASVQTELLEQLSLPLAPKDEQGRIADKLDRLLAVVDQCKARVDAIPAILKRFRQSVLAAAVSGRLTEEWRIGAQMPAIAGAGCEGLFEIPYGWVWTQVGRLADVKGGKRLPKGSKLVGHDTGLPYIKAGQLKRGTVDPKDQEFLLPDTQRQIARYIVDKGDVYITIVGACIGDAGMIPDSYDKANLTENAAKLCNFRGGIEAAFLSLWLRSPVTQRYIKFLVKSGAQGKLALMRIKEIPVPLPSVEEQYEVFRRVQVLLEFADRLDAQCKAVSDRVNGLTPSLLGCGFRGELFTQQLSD